MALDPVTRLYVNDKEIILVGTAHVSQLSVELVKKVIEEEKPDSVCIELDEKRYETMQNPKAWENTDIIQIIKTKRVGFMLANLILSAYQRRMAKKLGVTVGGEMTQAMESAKAVDAQLVLADREIQTTFGRIANSLTFTEKCKMIFSLLFSFNDDNSVDETSLQEMLDSDVLDTILIDMKQTFPKIGDILISERDQFLSHHIKHAPGKKIVAVLGGAHVPGVSKEINNEINIKQINTIPPKKPTMKYIAWLIPILILSLFAVSFANGMETGLEQLKIWLLWNGTLAALGTLIATGHPLSVLTSFIVAPISSLNPFLAAGWFSGLVQAYVRKPTVQDLQLVHEDIGSIKGFYRNKFLKVLLVVIMANLGSSLGTFIAGADIIQNLFS